MDVEQRNSTSGPVAPPPLSPSLDYATPAKQPSRLGPVFVLVTGFLTLAMSIAPWGVTFAALVGGIRPRSPEGGLAIAVVFGAIGIVVLAVALWMMISATRRLLR